MYKINKGIYFAGFVPISVSPLLPPSKYTSVDLFLFISLHNLNLSRWMDGFSQEQHGCRWICLRAWSSEF